MNPPQLPLHIQLMQMMTGYWVSQCIYVAAKLGVADRLIEAPQTYQAIADSTNTNASALYRVLRALASIGIFTETESGTFAMTPLAEYLRSDNPQSLQSTAIMLGDPEHYQAWGDLLHSVKTGEPAFDHRFGKGVFEYFGSNPDAALVFEKSMNNFSAMELRAIAPAYDFSEFKTLVDVGGGYGELLAEILQKCPHSKGILFDEKYVIDHAYSTLEKHGIADRCECLSGSFFDAVPTGGDAYLLKHIVHDWDDERAIKILQTCQKAMSEQSKILVIEQVVPAANLPAAAKMLDINMLVMCPGGKERTEAEFQSIFEQAGLKLLRIVPTAEDIHIVEGCKA
ncbi:methyltransferase [Pseudanabaena sp. FACHB-1998]|uniref:methyltransferase n=1 Tax=Pseudanabaena sp. FACHB-1998 TaxID=2692858 RepID=UPI0016819148|nr:methyltransferase [Pseudanabaena sp. FACHB-1998]MBD2178854.1 methyltransferase [Pseudanabaena sp. FACHB-1998]